MLQKETERPKLHCLHAIHLIKADLNLLIKILIAHQFVWHGDTHGMSGEVQGQEDPDQANWASMLYSRMKSPSYYDLSPCT